MSYSKDFRLCVVDNIRSGMSRDEAIRVFRVSRDSITFVPGILQQWHPIPPKKRYPYKIRKVDKKQFVKLIEEHPDATVEELAKPFSVYPSTIEYHLKRLGIDPRTQRDYAGSPRGK